MTKRAPTEADARNTRAYRGLNQCRQARLATPPRVHSLAAASRVCGEPNLMAIINGLIVAVFLILLVASVAVVGSMIVLTLFDLALSRRRPSGITAVINSDPEITNRSNLEMAFSNWRRERVATEED